MSNLTPEVRVNKNGVPVIKHVLPAQAASTAGAALPSPGTPPDSSVVDHEELAENAAMAVAGTLAGFGGDIDEYVRQRCYDTLVTFSDETLRAINAYWQDADSFEDAVFPYECINVLVQAGGKEQQFVHLMALEDVLSDEMGILDTDEAVARSAAMTVYDRHLDERPEASGDRTEYYVMLAKATAVLEEVWDESDIEESDETDDEGNPLGPESPITYHEVLDTDTLRYSTPLIEDQAMLKLLLDNVDRGDEIVDFMTERSTFDASFVAAYLNNSHRSLAEGTI